MNKFFAFVGLAMVSTLGVVACGSNPAQTESRVMGGEPDFKAADGTPIVEWAKKPANAKSVCQTLSQLKAQGFDAYSTEATNAVSRQFNLHPTEAEIVNSYVVEFTCPENGA